MPPDPAQPTTAPAKARLTITQLSSHSWRIHHQRPLKTVPAATPEGQPTTAYATISNHTWHKPTSYPRATQEDCLAYLSRNYGYNIEWGTLNGQKVDLYTEPLPAEDPPTPEA